MNQTKHLTAGIIIIGNEILSGRTQDVNIAHIAQKLNALGVHVREARVIPDAEDVIVDTVRQFHKAYDYVFTTGGIGSTHDDITAESISKAFHRDVEFNKEVVAVMVKICGTDDLSEGRLNMARMPVGAKLIHNPVTSIPGFQIENVFVMAGIPEVMRGMLDYALENVIPGHPILSVAIHCYLAEGDLAPGLRDIQNQNPEVEIGSYPFWRLGKWGATAVVRGQDKTSIDNTASLIRELMQSLGGVPQDEFEY